MSASLDPAILKELTLQLDKELDTIIKQYGSYVTSIRRALKTKGVCAKDLSSDLQTVSAFNHAKQKRLLLSAHETELKRSEDLNDVFNLLAKEYASFLNYGIFEYIIETYDIDKDNEKLKYPEKLKAYIKRHKISEFVKINPLLESFVDTSEQLSLILKVDIDATCRLAKIKDIETELADILELKPVALRIYDVKDGCVVVKFLIPRPVAEVIFNRDTVFTEDQTQQFQALRAKWLECNGFKYIFSGDEVVKEELQPMDEQSLAKEESQSLSHKNGNNCGEQDSR